MDLYMKCIIKKKGKWLAGILDGGYFKKDTEINSIKDVSGYKKYKTLRAFLFDHKCGIEPSVVYDKLKIQKMYVLDAPIRLSVKRFEQYWWQIINHRCQECGNSCKQSSKVTISMCPEYKPI